MPNRPEIEIQTDSARNLLRLAFIGHVTAPGLKAGRAAVEKAVVVLKKGFTVLTDLSRLDSMELDCVGELTRNMDLFRTHGVGTVVRVIPDPAKDIGLNILSIIHYRGGVKIVTCETAAEAERALK